MADFKFIELKIFINDPTTAHYEFAISNQSHIGENFGDEGSSIWKYKGFVLKSMSYPAAEYTENILHVRGVYPSHNDNYIYITPYNKSKYTVKRVNTWFIKMLNTIDAYNTYYEGHLFNRTNILHKY